MLQHQQGDQSPVNMGVTFADNTRGTRQTFIYIFALISRFISTPGITPAVAGISVHVQDGVTFPDQTIGTRLTYIFICIDF